MGPEQTYPYDRAEFKRFRWKILLLELSQWMLGLAALIVVWLMYTCYPGGWAYETEQVASAPDIRVVPDMNVFFWPIMMLNFLGLTLRPVYLFLWIKPPTPKPMSTIEKFFRISFKVTNVILWLFTLIQASVYYPIKEVQTHVLVLQSLSIAMLVTIFLWEWAEHGYKPFKEVKVHGDPADSIKSTTNGSLGEPPSEKPGTDTQVHTTEKTLQVIHFLSVQIPDPAKTKEPMVK